MRSRSLFRLLPLLLLALGGAREAAAQACLSTQGSNEYCKALTPAVRFGFPRYTTAALPTCNTSNKGAVAFDTTAGSYKGCDGSTWAAIGFSGGTITSPILAPAADNCANIPYSFSGDTNTGLCTSAADTAWIYANGQQIMRFTDSNIYLPTYPLSMGATAYIGDASTGRGAIFFSFDGTTGHAYQRGGNSPATSPQQYHWTYSYTDASNYQGGVLKTSASGIEIAAETAGSGADDLYITLSPAGGGYNIFNNGGSSTGDFFPSGDDSYDVGLPTIYKWRNLALNRSIQGSKTKALTEGAATAVTQIAVPQTAGSNSADAVVQWTVYATDGTDTQTRRGSTYLAAVNKAGTETCTVGDIGTPVVAVSAGTLTCTTSCITGLTDVVQFALDCTSSLTQTTLNAMVRLDMDQTNTVTPQ